MHQRYNTVEEFKTLCRKKTAQHNALSCKCTSPWSLLPKTNYVYVHDNVYREVLIVVAQPRYSRTTIITVYTRQQSSPPPCELSPRYVFRIAADDNRTNFANIAALKTRIPTVHVVIMHYCNLAAHADCSTARALYSEPKKKEKKKRSFARLGHRLSSAPRRIRANQFGGYIARGVVLYVYTYARPTRLGARYYNGARIYIIILLHIYVYMCISLVFFILHTSLLLYTVCLSSTSRHFISCGRTRGALNPKVSPSRAKPHGGCEDK